MIYFILGFFLGLLIGGFLGILIMALMAVASDGDNYHG